jgi:hypothetical protein
MKGNSQAKHFWKKNLFIETRITYDTDNYTVVVAQRIILLSVSRDDRYSYAGDAGKVQG